MVVKAFSHERREWTEARLADVKPGEEFIAHNRLYQVVEPEVYAENVRLDVAKLPDADRPYDPQDWRPPTGRDAVYAFDRDGEPLGHRLLANLDPGQRCVFQGLVYHIKPGPTPDTGTLVGNGEVDHRPDHRLYVWVEYTIQDALGTAEVGYRYPHGELIPLANGDVLPVEELLPGAEFLLEGGGTATVTSVGEPKRWDTDQEHRDAHGNGFRRVVGTFKFTGWVELMTMTVGGETHRVTPGHPYWSETRRGWYPIGTFAVGEMLLTKDKRQIPVEALTPPEFIHTTVYNFEVDEYHTYFVGRGSTAVWSHNGVGPLGGCGVAKAARAESGKRVGADRVGLSADRKFAEGWDAIFGKPKKANYYHGVEEGPVPGPNPNNLTVRRVDPAAGPTARGEGVYIKPHDGKTKVGSTNNFRRRYDLEPPEGGAVIEFEIFQTRTGPPIGIKASDAAKWTARRQRRFDEAYVDTMFKRDQLYRAPKDTAPVDPRKWRSQRHIFGYKDLPSNFVDGM